MKTNELTGAALDWAVAKCEGLSTYVEVVEGFKPSTDWCQGGSIIEREKFGVWFSEESVDDEGNPLGEAEWYCEACLTHYNADEIYRCMTGPTPLIAAMRCYVASKLGDEVELPELLK